MPSPFERLDSEIKAALIARDQTRLNLIRMLKSALKYHQIEKKLDQVSEGDLATVAQKMIKQHQDSIESFRAAGREDLLLKEQAELEILQNYVPRAFLPEELESLVKSVIEETKAVSRAQVGLVMKTAIAKAAGRADGKAINAMALKLLPA